MAINKVVYGSETLIDLTEDPAPAADVASGKTFHLANGVQATGTASGGGSDGSFSAFAGVPTIDGLGPVGGGAHSVGEYMEIPTVEPRLKLLEHVITYIINSPA